MARKESKPPEAGSAPSLIVPRDHDEWSDRTASSRNSNAMRVEMVAVSDLQPYPNNPRRHTQRQRRALESAMRRFGFVYPVGIDGGKGIISGHLRVEVAKELGYEEVPAVRVRRGIYLASTGHGLRSKRFRILPGRVLRRWSCSAAQDSYSGRITARSIGLSASDRGSTGLHR